MKELHQEIESYVSGEMPEEERAAFSGRLVADKKLAEEVAIYRQTEELLKDSRLTDFVTMLEEVRQEQHTVAKALQRRINNTWLLVAASLTLVIVATIILWPAQKEDAAKFYASNFKPYPSQVIRNENNKYPETLAQAFVQYRNQDYASAAAGFSRWQDHPRYKPTSDFYLAVAYLAMEDTKKAIDLLESQVASAESVYTQPAQWYLLLAYLKNGETQMARQTAETILTVKQHAYAEQAKEFIKKIKD